MRVESTVTTVSWIPSEAVTGMTKLPFEIGAMHYDDPPPDHIDDLEPLRAAGRFRFANRLAAWVDVEDGRITGHGYAGGGVMGLTRLSLGAPVTFAAIGLPDIQREPVVEHDRVRFTQTAGGRPAIPAPRHVNHPPFVQLKGPTVWTTLELVINADGSSTLELVGASRFPRHWVYDNDGRLAAKAGLADFKDWYRHAFGKHTPWGGEDSQTIRTAVESQLERELSTTIMRGGAKPELRKVCKDRTLVEQGDAGSTCTYCSMACSLSRSTAKLWPNSATAPSSASARPWNVAGARRPAGSQRLQGRGGPWRPARPRCAGRAQQRPPARGTLTRANKGATGLNIGRGPTPGKRPAAALYGAWHG